MVKIFNPALSINARLYLYGLVFFLLLIFSCNRPSKNMMVVWKDKDAVGISIPEDLVTDASSAIKNGSLKVANEASTSRAAMIGTYSLNNHSIIFEAAVPLFPGLNYVVSQNGKDLGTVNIPFDKNEQRPKLFNIYPLADTLPQNQLKMYLEFSKPMHRGQSLDYVKIIGNRGDTLKNVFLDLQPELWDTTGKILTLWLDPGRIKRGLVLNQKLGNPLKKAEIYKLAVSMDWQDNRGMKLMKYYHKQFLAGERQGKAPDMNDWQIGSPKAGSVQPLNIRFPTAMDHYLLLESIQVIDSKGETVKGHIITLDNDKIWQFAPENTWKSESYNVKAAGKLEDLAGNNLNRVFDRDITKDKQARDEQFYTKVFRILP